MTNKKINIKDVNVQIKPLTEKEEKDIDSFENVKDGFSIWLFFVGMILSAVVIVQNIDYLTLGTFIQVTIIIVGSVTTSAAIGFVLGFLIRPIVELFKPFKVKMNEYVQSKLLEEK